MHSPASSFRHYYSMCSLSCACVARVEQPCLVAYQGGEKLNGTGRVAGLVGRPGEIVAGGEGVGVIRAQDAQAVGEEFFVEFCYPASWSSTRNRASN